MPGAVPAVQRPHIPAIEAARGLAAAYVVLAHVFQVLGLKQALAEQVLLVHFAAGYAHQAVLLFFLLSGFSIHYASMHRPLDTWAGICHYLYLRLRRVLPIFVLVVAATLVLLVAGRALDLPGYQTRWVSVDVRNVLMTLGFMADREGICGAWATVLASNPPLWSLAYEMVYYLVYPLFWWAARRFGIGRAVGLSVLVSLVAWLAGSWRCDHVWNVLALYFIWCLGAWLAELKLRQERLPWRRPMLYALPFFALLAVWVTAESAWGDFDTPLWVLFFFPMMAAPVSEAALRPLTSAQRWLLAALFLLAAAAVAVLASSHPLSHHMSSFYARLVILVLVSYWLLLTDCKRWRHTVWARAVVLFSPVGSISYALYLVHYPLLVLAVGLVRLADVTPLAGLTMLGPIVLLAWWLERRLQPAIVPRLDACVLPLLDRRAAVAR